MEDTNPISIPLDPNYKLGPNKDIRESNHSNNYTSLIGSLQYLAVATQPDIAYTINCLAVYTANPSFKYYGAAKQLLKYIKGTKTYRITYHANATRHTGPNDLNIIHSFSDVAFTNADDYKSILGYTFLANWGVITWELKKQTTIILLITEAEYIALAEAAHDGMWLHYLYEELGYT